MRLYALVLYNTKWLRSSERDIHNEFMATRYQAKLTRKPIATAYIFKSIPPRTTNFIKPRIHILIAIYRRLPRQKTVYTRSDQGRLPLEIENSKIVVVWCAQIEFNLHVPEVDDGMSWNDISRPLCSSMSLDNTELSYIIYFAI